MNQDIARLQPYPFEKLAQIRADIEPPRDKHLIDLSLGEPRHEPPQFILDRLKDTLLTVSKYTPTRGTLSLRETIRDWLIERYHLPAQSLSANDHILPVNGTREGLFASAQCVVARQTNRPIVVCPNPFYQIYEGAALLAGADPWYVPCLPANNFIPDYDAVPQNVWQQCQLLYLCSPGNPTGAVLDQEVLAKLISLAHQHDFVIAADECYSEIYLDEESPPPGLLQAATRCGHGDYSRCLVFHSLSKRSNVPGLRSGFVAGDAELIEKFYHYRTYHGCAMPLYIQAASEAAWRDESHVELNRELYREKFRAVLKILSPILDLTAPNGAFYLWPRLPIDDIEFTRGLLASQNVLILPGSFLARNFHGANPGQHFARIALVGSTEQCTEAALRIRDHVDTLT